MTAFERLSHLPAARIRDEDKVWHGLMVDGGFSMHTDRNKKYNTERQHK